MDDFEHQLLQVLTRHLSVPTARGMVWRAREKASIGNRTLTAADMPRLAPQIEAGVRFFAPEAARTPIMQALQQLLGGPVEVLPLTRDIRGEADILQVRTDARGMCDQAGARSLTTQKVVTLVSELARNIVNYTPGGTIRLEMSTGRPLRIKVTATDQGSGITALETILSGNYRSKTGMGMGILGVKRLSDRFDIHTGATGTKVEAELTL